MIPLGQTQQDGVSAHDLLQILTVPICMKLNGHREMNYMIEICGKDRAYISSILSDWYKADGEPIIIHLN